MITETETKGPSPYFFSLQKWIDHDGVFINGWSNVAYAHLRRLVCFGLNAVI